MLSLCCQTLFKEWQERSAADTDNTESTTPTVPPVPQLHYFSVLYRNYVYCFDVCTNCEMQITIESYQERDRDFECLIV